MGKDQPSQVPAGIPTPQQKVVSALGVAGSPSAPPIVPSGNDDPAHDASTQIDSDEEFITNRETGVVDTAQSLTHPPSAVRSKARPSSAPSLSLSPLILSGTPVRNSPILPDRQLESHEKEKVDAVTPVTTPASDGTLRVQPAQPQHSFPGHHVENEPFDDDMDVPDINDALAPRFKPHEHHLSPDAIRCRSKRIFTKRADGSKKVSDEIWNDWHSRGNKRKVLEDIFKRCGYDPETWYCFSCNMLL